MGRRRIDPIEDLLTLSFGVRLDQPGQLVRDFQTARSLDDHRAMPLTTRYYLSDAAFLAGVEGGKELIVAVEDALRRPVYPLYLGRRSCPPMGPVVLGVRDSGLWGALTSEPRHVGRADRNRPRPDRVEIVIDAMAAPESVRFKQAIASVRDVPLSFNPERREYGWRDVVRAWVDIGGCVPDPGAHGGDHDPMALLGG